MHLAKRGVCYVAYGRAAAQEAERSIQALAVRNPDLIPAAVQNSPFAGLDDVQSSRWAKANLDRWSPYEHTLYLDADARPHGDLSAGFQALEDGWEMAIVPSMAQGEDCLWHVGEEERRTTFGELGREPVQLQAGVFFFRKTEAIRRLFAAWRSEWMRWKGQDQAALLRALAVTPVRLWLLGSPWNGGAVIDHRFGAIRRSA